jgi:Mor family transcriptional regulator
MIRFYHNRAKTKNRKLTCREVKEILTLIQFMNSREISEAYNISASTVYLIKTGHRWRNLTKLPLKKPNKSKRFGKKLCKFEVSQIRYSYKMGQSQNSLAKKYRVSQPVIFDIVHGRTHVV